MGGDRRRTPTQHRHRHNVLCRPPRRPPALTLLAAGPPDNSLWGVDVDGNAWRSRDGQTWQKNSYVGDVEALTAADYDTAYAATAQKLYTLT